MMWFLGAILFVVIAFGFLFAWTLGGMWDILEKIIKEMQKE